MKVNEFLINVNSAQPERLADFYRTTVGLQPEEGMGPSAFRVGGAVFIIDGHSDVTAGTREPQRVLIDFMVDDIAAEQARLESAGVKFLRNKGREAWGGVISTFADPDGNYCQLIEYKPEASH